MLRVFLAIIFYGWVTNSFAIFCPTNFNSINMGDTIKQVETQCGKPSAEKIYKKLPSEPQEWTYYIKLSPSDQGGMKVTMAFEHNKLVNMTSNGIGMSDSTLCGGVDVQLGNSMEHVKKACGDPTFVAKSATLQEDEEAPSIAEWLYQGSPNVTLVFENGILIERR